MNKVIFPIDKGMQGALVADLQDALQACLERKEIYANDEATRLQLSYSLKKERSQQFYGEATNNSISRFQKEHGLDVGYVDEPTANALNKLLRQWGLLDTQEYPRIHMVTGGVRRSDGSVLSGLHVRASHQAANGAIRLGEDITDSAGRYTIRYESLPGLAAVDLFVAVFDEEDGLIQSSDIIYNVSGLQTIDIVIQPLRHIKGSVFWENGLPAEGLRLRLYKHQFGGDKKQIGIDITTTQMTGCYSFSYVPDGTEPVLEVRAVVGSREISLTKPLHGLTEEELLNLNLVAPAEAKPTGQSEYSRLVGDIGKIVNPQDVKNISRLASAKENTEQQDITLLHSKTGWDARLIALTSLSEQLAADQEMKLPSEGLYGLLRAGLPSDKLLLAQIEPETVGEVLKKVTAAGIVSLDDNAIASFKKQFAEFSTQTRLNLTMPGSASTYGELLQSSGLTKNDQDKFAEVLFRKGDDGNGVKLWEESKKAGLSEAQISRLQMQGKCSFLAASSAAITNRLLNKNIDNLEELTRQDFHRAETWKQEIFSAAGIPSNRWTNLTDEDRDKLKTVIPSAFTGENAEARLELYAEDMARKIRLSYPTQTIARLMESDDSFKPLAGEQNASLTLLKNAAVQGFRLGETPTAAFLETKKQDVIGQLSDAEFQAAGQQLKTLQRLYQITPDNESMPVLMKMGITAAADVTAIPQDQFIARYLATYLEIYKKDALAGLPKLIYSKSWQVSSVTRNLFAVASQLNSTPAPAGTRTAPAVTNGQIRDELADTKEKLIKRYPTLEKLFGSMDYCECEHCRSVLSPAAYFVDLLQFIDMNEQIWANFLAEWKADNGGQEYPYKDSSGKSLKPYDVLIERRPDLPHIALTCENTHTALPYIDIANEILEYYVANGKLQEQAAQDTGDAVSSELLAEPQNVIREAYEKLAQVSYPLNLPFDRWLETVRSFCGYFELPLHRLLEVFRLTDALFDSSTSYDRATIFMESLGLSPSEVKFFTDPKQLDTWHELYGFTSAEEATTEARNSETGQRIDLHSAKTLSRRLGVTYKDLTEIVQTGFVNPELQKLVLLYKLRISIADARKNIEGLEQRIQDLAKEFKTSEDELRTAIATMPFDKVLVFADTDAGCNFDLTLLQYADGIRKAQPLDFLRINLFVRLWRKLGWSIEETDRALTAFIPAVALTDASQFPDWFKTALICLAHLKTLEEKVNVGKNSRIKILTLWTDMPATGKNSLYAQLFLAKSVLKSTPVFDHPLGHYLSDANIKIKEHLPALQGALGLAADDIAAILADAGKSTDDALSLSNVSLLYRYGLLAKGLKLSVHNLIALKQLSGLDPFKKLHSEPPQPLQSLNEDYPFTQAIAFVEIAETVQNSGLELEELDYLLRHRDPAGQHSPNRETTLALLKTLAEGISAIRAEHAVPDDSSALSSEVLRQKLGLVLPPDVMNTFLSMLNGTAEYTAVKSGVAQADSLPPAAFADQSSVREVKYKDVPNEQRLTFRGVLSSDAQKDKLRGATVTPSWTAGQQIVLSDLLNDVQTQAKTFFDAHLRKQSSSQPESGFLENADYDLLFAPAPDDLTEQEEQQRQRHNRLIQTFLPFLQNRLTRQFIVQTLVAQTGADPVLVESFITDDRLLKAGDKSMLAAALTAVAERGVSAAFYSSADLSGPQQAALTITTADTGSRPTVDSTRFAGCLEVAAPGAYRFFIELEKQDAEAELRVIHLPQPVFLSGTANGGNATLSNFLELKAGVPYHFILEVKNLNGGQARLLVQGETLPKGPLSQLKLYPAENWNAAEKALLLLAKSLRLVQGLGLSEREIRYMLIHADDFDKVNLSELPTVADNKAVQRFKQFLRLTKYTQLKREMAGGTDELISIFEANGEKMIDKVYQLIAKITRQNEATVKLAAEVLFDSKPIFASEQPLAKLWEVLLLVQRFEVSPAALKEWTEIVSLVAPAQKRFDIARNARDTIRAHFEEEAWQRVAQPIFDKLRQQSRDALVAHVMHQHNFERMEQLYEYFLVDPGMEPVVQTSRIRLAISSVQLFIQRCLMNLEPKVKPSVINSKQWEWMKRYRVWEANRKIFLFPENWLEPEFRDDKTHLFKELEGALLQGDVSKDLVEDAFFNYLKKLDELARLDMVAMHIENNNNPAQRVLHVFGRTYSQPHKYFYRRYKNQSWTPWEPVSAQIEGDHLAPMVWRDRLYLFWVTFLEKPQLLTGNKTITNPAQEITIEAPKKNIEAHLHWSEYINGEWSTRESSPMNAESPIVIKGVVSFEAKKVFIHVSTSGSEQGVSIHLGNWSEAVKAEESISSMIALISEKRNDFYLASRNSVPEKGNCSKPPENPFADANRPIETRYSGTGKFNIKFSKQKVNTEASPEPATILGNGNNYNLLPCNNNLLSLGISEESYRNAENPDKVKEAIEKGLDELATLMKPIFYQDNMNTFFVEPSVKEETIEKWDGWAVAIDNDPMPKRDLPTEVMVIPEIPRKELLINPIELQVNPAAAVQPVLRHDALINPTTVLKFGDALIGPAGQAGLEVVTSGLSVQASLAGHVNVNPASDVSASVVVSAEHTFTRSGLALAEGGLNVVGASGLNAALKQNITKLNR